MELTEIGPSFDFIVRRAKLASDELYKKAKKQPKEIEVCYIIDLLDLD